MRKLFSSKKLNEVKPFHLARKYQEKHKNTQKKYTQPYLIETLWEETSSLLVGTIGGLDHKSYPYYHVK